MEEKIKRTKNGAVVAGVCVGMAEYFNVDLILVRIAWVLLGFCGGIGIPAYILCWIIIPERPIENGAEFQNKYRTDSPDLNQQNSHQQDQQPGAWDFLNNQNQQPNQESPSYWTTEPAQPNNYAPTVDSADNATNNATMSGDGSIAGAGDSTSTPPPPFPSGAGNFSAGPQNSDPNQDYQNQNRQQQDYWNYYYQQQYYNQPQPLPYQQGGQQQSSQWGYAPGSQPGSQGYQSQQKPKDPEAEKRKAISTGMLLIIIGLLLAMKLFFKWFSLMRLLPAFAILAGIYIIANWKNE